MSLLFEHIEQMSREKGVDASVIIEAVEDAILTAVKKYYTTEEPYQARFNKETGQVEVFLVKTVVDNVVDPGTEINLREAKHARRSATLGSQVELHKPTDALGRIAAQTAKGAAALLLNMKNHPEYEIDKVTTPRGCTISGLNQMEHEGFSSAMIKGIVTSAEKASRLYVNKI